MVKVMATCKVCNILRNSLSDTERQEMEALMMTNATDFYIMGKFKEKGIYNTSHDGISRHRRNCMKGVPEKKESKSSNLQTPYDLSDLIYVGRRPRYR